MTVPQRVRDMTSYLEATGWQRRPEAWRGASLWDRQGGYTALVPARDGLDDASERTWELLQTLMKVENRPMEEIAEDIASPMTDTQSFHTYPGDLPEGYISLTAGLRALQGVRNLFDAAGRAELEGVRAAFSGTHPIDVGRMLDQVRLGPTKPGSYVLTVRVPVQDHPQTELLNTDAPLTRRTLVRLYHAIAAAHAATMDVRAGGDFSAFDETVEAGVSANFCRGLSNLAGLQRLQPFEVGFRWARAAPSGLSPASIGFPEGAGAVVFEAAKQLDRLAAGGHARITGVIESLHDEPYGLDRWRIRVRGELIAGEGEVDRRRPVWIRLDESDYQRAIEAHREHRTVRAQGRLELVQRRVELHPQPEGFEIDP